MIGFGAAELLVPKQAKADQLIAVQAINYDPVASNLDLVLGNRWVKVHDDLALSLCAMTCPGDNNTAEHAVSGPFLVYQLPIDVAPGESTVDGKVWQIWFRMRIPSTPNSFFWQLSTDGVNWIPSPNTTANRVNDDSMVSTNFWYWQDQVTGNPGGVSPQLAVGVNWLRVGVRESGALQDAPRFDVVCLRNYGDLGPAGAPSDAEVIPLLTSICPPAPPPVVLSLAEFGGTFAQDNLARGPGAAAFSSVVFVGSAANLNDGIYGFDSQWIGMSGQGFAGINLGGRFTVQSVAFGSANTPDKLSNERYAGTYTVQYTNVDDPDEFTSDDDWVSSNPLVYDIDEICPPKPWARHRYNFADPVEATAVRILVPYTGPPLGTLIDEIEVYSQPGTVSVDPCEIPPALDLLQTGGPIDTPAQPSDVPNCEEGNNVARAGDAAAFGSQTGIGAVNDGLYGGASSWVGDKWGPKTGQVYAGIYFTKGRKEVSEIALGRDNLGADTNRTTGPHLIEYTEDEFDYTDDAAVDGANWVRLGLAAVHTTDGKPGLRHRYGFISAVQARAFRVVTRLLNIFDEIELTGTDCQTILPPPPPVDLTLAEFGGTFAGGNLARGAGAFAFSSDVFVGSTANLNDGVYGFDSQWIGMTGQGFVGINLGGLQTVQSVAWGSANTADKLSNERYVGIYTLQYTNVDNPDQSTPEPAWVTADTVDYDVDEICPPHPWARHRYNFSEPVQLTAIRILVPHTGPPLGTLVDEVEAYAVPGEVLVDPCEIPPPLELLQTGGPIDTPAQPTDVPSLQDGNLSRAGDAVPFGSQTGIGAVNDGLYGGASSWVGDKWGPKTGQTYAGIYFSGGLKDVEGIALGRDNLGADTNRTTGPHLIEYTEDEFDYNDDAAVGGAHWIRLGLASAHTTDGKPGLRHRYGFGAVQARAVRVVTRFLNIFDEVEVLGKSCENNPPHVELSASPPADGIVAIDSGASTDGDNGSQTLTRQWTLVSGPAGAALDDTSTVLVHLTLAGPGQYVVRLTITDSGIPGCSGSEKSASSEITITVEIVFKRGDANVDGLVNITDVIAFLGWNFLGDPPSLACPDAADADDSGDLTVTDAIANLGWQFLGQPKDMPTPGANTCGHDGPDTPTPIGPCNYPAESCQGGQ